jgi:hypothetical protein
MGRDRNELWNELEEQRQTSEDGLGPRELEEFSFSEINFLCENNSSKT